MKIDVNNTEYIEDVSSRDRKRTHTTTIVQSEEDVQCVRLSKSVVFVRGGQPSTILYTQCREDDGRAYRVCVIFRLVPIVRLFLFLSIPAVQNRKPSEGNFPRPQIVFIAGLFSPFKCAAHLSVFFASVYSVGFFLLEYIHGKHRGTLCKTQ